MKLVVFRSYEYFVAQFRTPMNLIKKLTQKVDKEKLTDSLLILTIIILSVVYKLHKMQG